MRFLLDENTHGDLARALSQLGHDVVQVQRTVSDAVILIQAVTENRILVTHDRDFGDLVFRQASEHRGGFYLRLNNRRVDLAVERIQAALAAGFPGDAFLVITHQTIRRRT